MKYKTNTHKFNASVDKCLSTYSVVGAPGASRTPFPPSSSPPQAAPHHLAPCPPPPPPSSPSPCSLSPPLHPSSPPASSSSQGTCAQPCPPVAAASDRLQLTRREVGDWESRRGSSELLDWGNRETPRYIWTSGNNGVCCHFLDIK